MCIASAHHRQGGATVGGHRRNTYSSSAGSSSETVKEQRVIRVRVPLDLHSVASSGAAAFALATPLRVRELLALAVREAIGNLAPQDKFARSMHRTLKGLSSGDYTLAIDGRIFADPETIVVCTGTADVRFFTSPRAVSGRVAARTPRARVR